MMHDVKTSLEVAEKSGNVRDVLNLLDKISRDVNVNVEVYLRVIFILLDFLVEGDNSINEQFNLAQRLKWVFDISYKRFGEDAEYLAFMGMMITRAEWFFDKSFEEGIQMIKKACEIEPNNLCYRTLYFIFEDQRQDANKKIKLKLLRQLFSDQKSVNMLLCKGILGKYVYGIFEGVLEA